MTEKCRNYCKGQKQLDKPYNRAGLPHIGYRIGAYSDFREFILQELDLNRSLRNLTYRNPDDPSIAILEGAALLGDILTFYQELYANEAFLRTAQWKESISALVRLTGYRLSPGYGGTANVAFEVKAGNDITIPKGFPVKAQLEGSNESLDFETNKEFVAVPSLGKFRLYRKTSCPNSGQKMSVFSILTSDLELAGQKIEIKDRLMFFGMTNYSNHPIITITKVEQKFDRTYLYTDALIDFTGQSFVTVYKVGRTFRYFGYNAPPTIMKTNQTTAYEVPVTCKRYLSQDKQYTIEGNAVTKFTSTEFPINGEVPDIVIGSTIIIESPKGTVVKTVEEVRLETMTWGAITGPATVLSVDRGLIKKEIKSPKKNDKDITIGVNVRQKVAMNLAAPVDPTILTYFTDLLMPEYFTIISSTADIRKIVIHETIGNPFTLESIPKPISDPDGLYYFGDLKSYLKLQNRRLALRKEDGTYVEITAGIDPKYNNSSDPKVTFRRITYDKPENWPFSEEDFQLDNPAVEVYGNLVKVTQGKKQKEVVLGNGDAREVFQTFKLPKFPLTYVNAENGECEPKLEVYVNDRMWKRVDTLLNCKPSDEVYVVREDEEGASWLQFGDGKAGRRLPTGFDNITAIYWTGIGAHGEMAEGTDPQAGDKLNRLEKVKLPWVVSGGCEPESGEKARQAAPGKTQSLGRLVSLKDFEIEALALPGIVLASAVYDIVDDTPLIMLTVLMENGREKEIKSIMDTMNRYNICRGTQRYPVSIIEGKHKCVYIDAEVGRDLRLKWQVVEKNIREALGAIGDEGNGTDSSRGLFSVGMRGFGEDEYATRIEGVIQNVNGVVWVKVRQFLEIIPDPTQYSANQLVDPSDLPIPPHPILKSTVTCEKNAILCLHIKHLTLHDVTSSQEGDCR